jgi:hypothetical protein
MTDPLSALGSDVFLVVAAHFALSELAQVLCVRKAWRTLLDGTPHLWRGLCKHVWASKAHVPAALSVLAEGEFAEMAEDEERRTLMHLRARELKDLVMSLRLERESRFLIEKGDFADAILSARRKAAEASSVTFTILNRPLQLVRREAGESLPKAALRLSLLDAQRLHITKEELMSFTFNVRVRHDGPLMQAMEFDPWWQGKGRGEATFEPDGLVAFKYATRPAARYACRNARQRNATQHEPQQGRGRTPWRHGNVASLCGGSAAAGGRRTPTVRRMGLRWTLSLHWACASASAGGSSRARSNRRGCPLRLPAMAVGASSSSSSMASLVRKKLFAGTPPRGGGSFTLAAACGPRGRCRCEFGTLSACTLGRAPCGRAATPCSVRKP